MTVESSGRRYRVEHLLGKGGFGTVYHATMLGAGGFTRSVAVKLLNDDVASSHEIAARMRDEARVLGLVRHRAIVHVDGLVKLDGRWAVIMEYVDGVDLTAVIDQGAVPQVPALEIVEEVARALHAAYHALNSDGHPLCLMHRDIKPPNVRITSQGEVKLLDFGIARADFEDREVQTRSLFFGSTGYIAPERLDRVETPKGDVYSLGVVLYEMLAGDKLGNTSAHPARHDDAVRDALLELRTSGIDQRVIELVGRALEYEPEDRPTSRELASACRDVSRQLQGAHLVDWAEGCVLAAQAGRQVSSDAFSGQILTEGSGTRSMPEGATLAAEDPAAATMWTTAETSPRRRTLGWVVGGGAIVTVLVVVVPVVLLVVGGLGWYLLAPSTPVVVSAPPSTSSDRTQPLEPSHTTDRPTAETSAPPLVQPELPHPPATSTTSAPAPPVGFKVEPVDDPVQIKPGTMKVIGVPDSAVTLRSAAGTFEPGRVPPGRYSVTVQFDLGAIDGPQVDITSGRAVTLACDPGFMSCEIRQ